MKSLRNALSVFVMLHLIAAGALLIWLFTTGRLDRQRLSRVVEMFEMTIEQEKAQEAKADQLAEAAMIQAREAARLESLKDGPITIADRLDADQKSEEITKQRLEWLSSQKQELQGMVEGAMASLAKERATLDAEREAFEKARAEELKARQDADFAQALRTYEQLPAKQTKQMFQALLARGDQQQVVDYLAAMNLRKAVGVLKEFKTPAETAQASELVEMLRLRGVNLVSTTKPAAGEVQSDSGSGS